MSRTMIKAVHEFETHEAASGGGFDLEAPTSPYGAFLKRYRATYPAFQEGGQGSGYQLSEKELKDLAMEGGGGLEADAAAAGGTTDEAQTDFLTELDADGGGGADRTKQQKNKGKSGTDDHQPQTIYAVLPTKFTIPMLQDFAVDCYGMLWAVLARQGNEGLCEMTRKYCNKKRLSQRSNDFRMKGFLDFYFDGSGTNKEGVALLESSPHAVLFGKSVGLLPRRLTAVRKAWGAIAASVLGFAYIEKCWRSAELIDSEGKPPPAEFKTKVNKLLTNRQLPIRRAVQMIFKLGEAMQPHWTMSPFKAACEEYNARQPWVEESVSRVLHLVLYAALWVNGRIKESPPMHEEKHAHVESPTSSPGQHHHQHHHRARSYKGAHEEEAGAPGPVVGLRLLRALNIRATQLWAARSHKASPGNPPTVADVMLLTERNTFVELTLETAAEIGGKLHMGVCELALACIEAWEAEYLALQADIKKAVVSSTRRPAIAGTYNSSNASLRRDERLAMVRLLKYYNEHDKPGVDWMVIKAASDAGSPPTYPFQVPRSLLCKTVAELNYHSERIIGEYEREKAKEFLEDLAAASGPYAKSPALPYRPPGSSSPSPGRGRRARRRNNVYDDPMPPPMSPEETRAANRAEYLASHTLGSGGPHGQYPPRTGSAAVALPLPLLGERDDESFVTAVHTANSDALDALSLEQSMTMSDSRPSLHAYLQHQEEHLQQQQQRVTIHERQSREFMRDSFELAHSTRTPSQQQRPVSSADALGLVPPGVSRQRSPLKQPLSTVPYASPLPARHVVSMVDIMENDVDVLTKVKLLSAEPVGPATSKARLRSLDEELFGALDFALASSQQHGDGEYDDDEDEEDEGESWGGEQKTSSSTSASKQALLEQMTAKQRVFAKIEADKKRRAAKEGRQRAIRLAEKARRAAEEPLPVRSIDELMTKADVKDALGLGGKPSRAGEGGSLSVEGALAKEQAVQLLQLTHLSAAAPVTASTWINVADWYLKPFQLATLLKIDFTDANMGAIGGAALGKALRVHCSLLDLRLGGNVLGDPGCEKVLRGIAAGGGGATLQVLDLSSNNLTMLGDGLAVLGQLTALKQLSLANNKLTLDLPRHHSTLRAGLAPLSGLVALSMSGNRIQDAGFGTLAGLFSGPGSFPALSLLDLQTCFITPLSYDAVISLIKDPASAARTWCKAGLQLQNNMFTLEQIGEIKYAAHIRHIPIFFTGSPSQNLFDVLELPYTTLVKKEDPVLEDQEAAESELKEEEDTENGE